MVARASNRGAAEIPTCRLCVCSRGYFKFQRGGRPGAARVSIFQRQAVLCDGRRIREINARFEGQLLSRVALFDRRNSPVCLRLLESFKESLNRSNSVLWMLLLDSNRCGLAH